MNNVEKDHDVDVVDVNGDAGETRNKGYKWFLDKWNPIFWNVVCANKKCNVVFITVKIMASST